MTVTHPRWTPRFVAKKFAHAQQDWIEAQLKKLNEKRTFSGDLHTVSVFGKKYQKKLLDSLEHAYGVTISEGEMLINKFSSKDKTHQFLLERFLKNTAEKYIVPRTHALAKRMGLGFNKLTLRAQKTRWGSCSSQKNLNFNSRLVHYLPNIIDYVIIHELAHLVHMNHSRDFWLLVEKYDPEYKKHRGFLKRCGMVLG